MFARRRDRRRRGGAGRGGSSNGAAGSNGGGGGGGGDSVDVGFKTAAMFVVVGSTMLVILFYFAESLMRGIQFLFALGSAGAMCDMWVRPLVCAALRCAVPALTHASDAAKPPRRASGGGGAPRADEAAEMTDPNAAADATAVDGRHPQAAVSYTHLTLPTICSV